MKRIKMWLASFLRDELLQMQGFDEHNKRIISIEKFEFDTLIEERVYDLVEMQYRGIDFRKELLAAEKQFSSKVLQYVSVEVVKGSEYGFTGCHKVRFSIKVQKPGNNSLKNLKVVY